MKRRISCFILCLIVLCLALPAQGQEPDAMQIHSVEDLMKIGQNPQGSYILMEDLDMAGVNWPCPAFYGSFNGNGHAILNLTLTQPGETTAKSYDGNRKSYETWYAGLFSVLKDARVENLTLLNVRACIQTDLPMFVAGIAGYMENSVISGCTVTGILELRAHDRIFGVGGVAGYGSGLAEYCSADVTLICVDTNAKTKDEQFLGGLYASGFVNMTACNVRLDGYISDHGYVHSGGLTGMFLQYPWGWDETGCIQDNHIEGKITFFEDNDDRRAYCNALVGETLVFYDFYRGENTKRFQRDERWTYKQELRPDMCAEPEYTKAVTQPGCDSFGYTQYTCTQCGYQYVDHYTLKRHTVNKWVLEAAPTADAEGLSVGTCRDCGETFTQTIPKLAVETVPATVPTTAAPTVPTAEPTQPVPEQKAEPDGKWLLWIAGGAVLLAVLVLMTTTFRKKTKK